MSQVSRHSTRLLENKDVGQEYSDGQQINSYHGGSMGQVVTQRNSIQQDGLFQNLEDQNLDLKAETLIENDLNY